MQHKVSRLKGEFKREIQIPGDKSISHRSVMFGAIAQGRTEVSNFLTGEDCLCTKKAFEALGADIQLNNKSLVINGKGFATLQVPKNNIYLGNSGTAMRLLAGLFAGLPFKTILTGDESLSSRPMKRVLDPLDIMGARIDSQDGKAPLIIHGGHKLKAIKYQSPIASAQVKSCILLAGLNAEGTSTVIEAHQSRDHTERMMQSFGADLKVSADGLSTSITGHPNNLKLTGQRFSVPGDISSAAFFMVAAAILEDAELLLRNVGINPTRTGIINVFQMMNANFTIQNKHMEGQEPVADILVKSSQLKACTIEGEIIPRLIDEIPVIAVLAAQAQGLTVIKNAEELKVKESNRIATTVNMLKILGVQVQETDDGMIIEGRAGKAFEPVGGPAVIDTKGDHRIAMSSAVAGLHSNLDLEILQTEFVATSFPGFFELLPQELIK
jgi:3-phosphoshikimate 1-carboxyvinyltransferase